MKNRYDLKSKRRGIYPRFNPFSCIHCSLPVSSDPGISGVNNRNHCPYCLWSKHVDLFSPGDRLSACRSPMKPVGLGFKRVHKKYGDLTGEMVLIHHCLYCDSISINRLAADDDPEQVLNVFLQSVNMDRHILYLIRKNRIQCLGIDSLPLVEAQLFGRKKLS